MALLADYTSNAKMYRSTSCSKLEGLEIILPVRVGTNGGAGGADRRGGSKNRQLAGLTTNKEVN